MVAKWCKSHLRCYYRLDAPAAGGRFSAGIKTPAGIPVVQYSDSGQNIPAAFSAGTSTGIF
jgi:hypothetical protein